jgi:hypothetical protein
MIGGVFSSFTPASTGSAFASPRNRSIASSIPAVNISPLPAAASTSSSAFAFSSAFGSSGKIEPLNSAMTSASAPALTRVGSGSMAAGTSMANQATALQQLLNQTSAALAASARANANASIAATVSQLQAQRISTMRQMNPQQIAQVQAITNATTSSPATNGANLAAAASNSN